MKRRIHPTSAIAVANWFLNRSWKEPNVPSCDQMKLYKLTYYANAWYLGNLRQELYPEDVQAWPHGPVISGLYSQFKSFQRNAISQLGTRLEVTSSGKYEFVTPEHDGSLNTFFEDVWNLYKDKTGIQLSNMTHLHGEPWTIVAEMHNYDLSSKPTISSEIIGDIFAKRVKNGTVD